MAFTEDFSVFLSTDEFAVQGLLNGVQVSLIFDRDYSSAAAGFPGVATSLPMATLPTDVVPASVVGKNLQIDSTTFKVVEHHPDGTGLSTLVLELA